MTDATKIIGGAIAIIIGLVLMPVMATFTLHASQHLNASGVWVDDTNVTGIAGLTSLINLVMYGFTFSLVFLGLGLIYIGFKGDKIGKIGKHHGKKHKWWKR